MFLYIIWIFSQLLYCLSKTWGRPALFTFIQCSCIGLLSVRSFVDQETIDTIEVVVSVCTKHSELYIAQITVGSIFFFCKKKEKKIRLWKQLIWFWNFWKSVNPLMNSILIHVKCFCFVEIEGFWQFIYVIIFTNYIHSIVMRYSCTIILIINKEITELLLTLSEFP